MADEQKPAGSDAPAPEGGAGAKPPAPKPAAAPHAAPPKPPATMASVAWDGDLSRELKERFGTGILETASYLGQDFVVCKAESAISVLEYLKLEADFDYLVDLTAVDWPKKPERFEVVYVVYSFARNQRLRLKIQIPEGFRPDTAVGVHLGANWLEREVFDMFGIEFAGHPDMRRILLPEEWRGYPLRKDYSILQQDQTWVQENMGIESGQ